MLCSEASSQIPVIVVVLLMLMFDWGEEWHYDQDNSYNTNRYFEAWLQIALMVFHQHINYLKKNTSYK